MPGWTMMRNRWITLRGEERTEFDFTHRIFSAAELEALLKQEGCVVEGTFGGLNASSYDLEAKRLVVVARI
jgi:hypothetical protein